MNTISFDINDFTRYLLAGDNKQAVSFVENLYTHQKWSVEAIYSDVFHPSLYEIGLMWERGEISVADEHLATAIVERCMNVLYPYFLSENSVGRKAVVSCLANEYHQIGGKMVADMFELRGWDTYFLGANTPLDDLLGMIETKKPHCVALSQSIPNDFRVLAHTIEKILEIEPDLPILIGGQAFGQQPNMIESFSGKAIFLSGLADLNHYLTQAK